MRALAGVVAFAAVACGSGSLAVSARPAATGAGPGFATPEAQSPDVPTWRGGCFYSGPAGKIVNGSPSPDVRLFGSACATPPGPGGLVYLDRYDPVASTGDVTVLSSEPGSAPVVIARNGGSGTADPASSGARFDDAQRRVLALADLTFVTGQLVVAELPAGAPVQVVASGVRVDNYEFVGDGGVIFVGNYDASARQGDLFYWNGATPQLIAATTSRFDFVMYRLDPARARVAYLRGYTDLAGGDLFVQPVPPAGAEPAPLASGVRRMSWTADGRHLVFRTVSADGITYALWSWDGEGAPVQLAPAVASAAVLGNDVLYTTDWSVLTGQALLHLVSADGGPDLLGAAGPASPAYASVQPPGAPGELAYLVQPDAADPFTGDLFVTRLSGSSPARLDTGVSARAGYQFSPGGGFVSYAVGFEQPQSPGSANPQPGLAREVRVAGTVAGTPFVLTRDGSTFVAWDPQERFVAGIADLVPAASYGTLVVSSTADGARLFSSDRAGISEFGFAADGSALWVVHGWDDAMRRGELLLAPTSGPAAWQQAVIAQGVTAVAGVSAGRVIYCVQGSGRDGLWLGALP